MTVVDPQGREWSVKQSYPGGFDAEGPVEVASSRLLSAVGYHQPPVYYLPAFILADDFGTRVEVGGRFRLKEPSLKETGDWAWEDNPFVGTRPYQGLLAMLMMFNSTDLKNSNNSLYERRIGDLVEQWYVVRDVGAALGDTDRICAEKGASRRIRIEAVRPRRGEWPRAVCLRRLVPMWNSLKIRLRPPTWSGPWISWGSCRVNSGAMRFVPAATIRHWADRFIRKLRDKMEKIRKEGSVASERSGLT